MPFVRILVKDGECRQQRLGFRKTREPGTTFILRLAITLLFTINFF